MIKPFPNCAGWLVCLLLLVTARSAMAQSTSLLRTNTIDSQTVGATVTNGSSIPLGKPRTVRWSLVPDGTKVPSFYYAGSDPNRPSRLIVDLDNDFSVPAGSRGADLTARPWFSSFQNMVNRIANKTGFTFIYEPNDDGREIGASSSDGVIGVIGVRGDLRLGGGPLSGALGYNGIPTGGHPPDMILDTNYAWTSSTLNFIATHELHHGLGFGHVLVNDNGNASAVTGIGGNSNGPQFHDLIQLHRKYGDTFESPLRNDTRANATLLGSLVPGGTLRAGSNWGTGVNVGGLDFATAGYSLGGASLLTLSPDAEIRVATGTTTISSPLAATTLAKSGDGMLLLNGSIGTLTGLALDGGMVNLQPTDEVQITGPITGTGALRKSGGWDSLLTLGGANTFTREVTIAAGALRLTRADSLGIGTVAALTTGSSMVNTSAGLAPGVAGIGKLTVAGTAVIGPRSRYTWQLGDANGTAGVAWDLLQASSLQLTATPSQPLEITFLPSQVANLPTTPRAFVIARGLGGLSGFNAAAVVLDSGPRPQTARPG